MKEVNLIYHRDASKHGNFGDVLSRFITEKMINKTKYKLVFNQPNMSLNLVCIGSYIHMAEDGSYIFGSGVRTPNNIENGHRYNDLKVCCVRGPLSRYYLIKNKKIHVPEIYGDPALLLPKYYNPKKMEHLKEKIGIVPHKSNFIQYLNNIDENKYHLINPTDKWNNVIDCIYSCKAVISSSLHGLICADAYDVPNLWLDEYAIKEGDFKFKDYFYSQKRNYVKIKKLEYFDTSLLYTKGNTIDLNRLLESFPFS